MICHSCHGVCEKLKKVCNEKCKIISYMKCNLCIDNIKKIKGLPYKKCKKCESIQCLECAIIVRHKINKILELMISKKIISGTNIYEKVFDICIYCKEKNKIQENIFISWYVFICPLCHEFLSNEKTATIMIKYKRKIILSWFFHIECLFYLGLTRKSILRKLKMIPFIKPSATNKKKNKQLIMCFDTHKLLKTFIHDD